MNRISFLFGILTLCGLAYARPEMFGKMGSGSYAFSFSEAYKKCHSIGETLASRPELIEAQQQGYSVCACGWLSDHTAAYPITEEGVRLRTTSTSPNYRAQCGHNGINNCEWRTTWNVYCIGYEPMKNCSRSMGLETGEVRDEQFAASSVNKAWFPHLATLNRNKYAWMPNNDDRNQYLEISFKENMAITGIMTQGAARFSKAQYVTAYKIAFTRDGSSWNYFMEGKEEKIFDGNSDANGQVRNWFNPPVEGTQIRIYPYSWVKHITLRVELFGCTHHEHDVTAKLQNN